MEWRAGRSSPPRGASGTGSCGGSRAGTSCEARVSRSDSQPVRPLPELPLCAGLSEGASARRGGTTGGLGGALSVRARGGGAPPLASAASRRGGGAASWVSARRVPGSTVSRLRPWRATMRLSSASASIWSTITRRIWAALSAVSCGSSRMPLRSSVRVASSSCDISVAIRLRPSTTSAKRCAA